MRWDPGSGQYDMGFRNYDPGLNAFLSRDMYNGALADVALTTDPFTGGRYAFGDGNPITNIELDGHMFPGGTPCNPSPLPATSGGPSLQQVIPTCPIGMLACFAAGFTEAPPRPQAPPVGGQNPPGSGDMGWLRWLPALAAAIAASGDLPPKPTHKTVRAAVSHPVNRRSRDTASWTLVLDVREGQPGPKLA